jgi:uncharacterized integral membrane protein
MIPLLFGFILGIATIIFALQNPAIVSLDFLGWGFESSLAAVILLATAIGGVLGILFSLPSIIKKSFTIRTLRKENQGLRNEADTLQQWNEQTVAHYESRIAPTAVEVPLNSNGEQIIR